MRVSLRVQQAGFATVQDLGRPGHGLVGIAANGAADRHAARTANTLVGNPPGRPVVEVTGSAFALTPDADVLLAVTGAADRVDVDGAGRPSYELLAVPAGCRVTVPAPTQGWRSYVAVNGLLDAPATLGSVAPDPLLGVGTTLAAGDTIGVESRYTGLDHPHVPLFRFGADRPALDRVDVTDGPEYAELTGSYEVSPRSDQVGLRLFGSGLLGAAPARTVGGEILSRGVPVGAVEAPPGGGLLVLLRGRLVTAGYPVVAVATTTGIDRLAQARPGDRLTFRRRTTPEAVAALRQRETELLVLSDRVRRALAAGGLTGVLG